MYIYKCFITTLRRNKSALNSFCVFYLKKELVAGINIRLSHIPLQWRAVILVFIQRSLATLFTLL